MNNDALVKHIKELEVMIVDTEKSIARAVFISCAMSEPNKLVFMETIHRQQAQLDNNKIILNQFKSMLKD